MTHMGHIGSSVYTDILYSPHSKMETYCIKNKNRGGKTDAWMRSEGRLHHVTSQLYSATATSTKQRGRSRRLQQKS